MEQVLQRIRLWILKRYIFKFPELTLFYFKEYVEKLYGEHCSIDIHYNEFVDNKIEVTISPENSEYRQLITMKATPLSRGKK